MELSAAFLLAIRALARNKLRSSLTMLGIIIGVGAVIAVVGIGQGAAAKAQEQLAALGANMLFIGEVVMFHVADHLLGPRLQVNNFAPIGRLGSPSVYCRTTDRFDIARISYAQLLASKNE